MLNPVSWFRLSRALHCKGVPLLPRVIDRVSQMLFHCYLPHTADIGPGFEVGYHGIGVVVHSHARIGRRVFLGPGVVIGGRSQRVNVPVIEDGVYIAAGAKILGDVVIGRGSVVGANAVVLESLPEKSVAVGVPAKVIRTGVSVNELTGWPGLE